MKNFLTKTCFFIIALISLLILKYWMNNGSLEINYKKYIGPMFYKKSDYFSEFIKKNEPVNLILGSSTIRDAIIPDSLGPKWFSFTMGGQNIYESYKFIDYYKDSLTIDTIIIGIQPFDFPYSYIINREHNRPELNGKFYIFGRDSITTLLEKNWLRDIQLFKEAIYIDINQLFSKMVQSYKPDVFSKQGYSGKIGIDNRLIYLENNPIRLIYLENNPKQFDVHLRLSKNFFNVKRPPNLFYFELFDSLANVVGKKVIYLNTPKSKKYHEGLNNTKYDKIWAEILDSLKMKEIVLWDYGEMVTDNDYFVNYWEGMHASYNGAKSFTEKIRKKLYGTPN